MTKTITPSASRMTAGAPDQPKDSSLPKTAGPLVQNGALSPREMAIADYAAQEARKLAMEQCAKLVDGWHSILNAWYSDEANQEVRDRHAARANLCIVISKEIRDLANEQGAEIAAEEQVRVIAGTQSNPKPEGG